MNRKEKTVAVVSCLVAVVYAMLGFCMANPIYVTPYPEETDHREVAAAMLQRWQVITNISYVVAIVGVLLLVNKLIHSERADRCKFGVITNLVIILLLAMGAVICGLHWIGFVEYGLALLAGVLIFVKDVILNQTPETEPVPEEDIDAPKMARKSI